MSQTDRIQPDLLERLEEALHRHPWWPQLTLTRVGDALEVIDWRKVRQLLGDDAPVDEEQSPAGSPSPSE